MAAHGSRGGPRARRRRLRHPGHVRTGRRGQRALAGELPGPRGRRRAGPAGADPGPPSTWCAARRWPRWSGPCRTQGLDGRRHPAAGRPRAAGRAAAPAVRAARSRPGSAARCPQDLTVAGPRAGDPADALRLSMRPDDLPSFALAQLVCTYGTSTALGRRHAAVLGGPGDDVAHRYDCSAMCWPTRTSRRTPGWGDPLAQKSLSRPTAGSPGSQTRRRPRTATRAGHGQDGRNRAEPQPPFRASWPVCSVLASAAPPSSVCAPPGFFSSWRIC